MLMDRKECLDAAKATFANTQVDGPQSIGGNERNNEGGSGNTRDSRRASGGY